MGWLFIHSAVPCVTGTQALLQEAKTPLTQIVPLWRSIVGWLVPNLFKDSSSVTKGVSNTSLR